MNREAYWARFGVKPTRSDVTLYQGDCLVEMKKIPDASVDLILADLPYETTAHFWDLKISFEPLWKEYWRVAKPNTPIVLTASQPFTTILITSQIKYFRYTWVWDKVNRITGSLTANKRPMKRHEDVVVFFRKQSIYNKQFIMKPRIVGGRKDQHGSHVNHGPKRLNTEYEKPTKNDVEHNPESILQFKGFIHPSLHKTQKPVELMEYMIRTYTNPGMTVLDNCMGSGTTGVACVNTNRRFIGIEQDPTYFAIAKNCILNHKPAR